MNGLLKYSFPICFSLLALFACEDDGIDVDNIEVPAGFALSAGTATNFLTSSYAYDRSADWITGAYDKRFTRGDKLYDDIRTSSNGIGGGRDRFMPVILVVAVTEMPDVRNLLCGAKVVPVAPAFRLCWFILVVRMELSFRIMDVCFMIRLFMV